MRRAPSPVAHSLSTVFCRSVLCTHLGDDEKRKSLMNEGTNEDRGRQICQMEDSPR